MKKNDFLFVYGSLRRGERADLSPRLGAKYMGEAEINGLLYGVAWYPGVKLLDFPDKFTGEIPTVKGDVFQLLDDDIITLLDAYEGYPDLFGRSEVTAKGGQKVWVYTYNGDVWPESLVPSGDWKIGVPMTLNTDMTAN